VFYACASSAFNTYSSSVFNTYSSSVFNACSSSVFDAYGSSVFDACGSGVFDACVYTKIPQNSQVMLNTYLFQLVARMCSLSAVRPGPAPSPAAGLGTPGSTVVSLG
jgi:hypothetical protein